MAQLPEPSLRDKVGFLEHASRNLLAQGITSVHDAATSLETIDIFRKYAFTPTETCKKNSDLRLSQARRKERHASQGACYGRMPNSRRVLW